MKAGALDLFIFADALGWKLVEERAFLPELFTQRRPCDTLLGYSCTCDPTILTGCLPPEHGHFSFFVHAPGRSPFGWARALSWIPEPIAAHHRVRNRISRYAARLHGFTGYFQLYSVPFHRLPHLDYTEKRDLYEPGGIIGGQRTVFEFWQESGRPWIRSDWRRGDAENVAHLLEHLDRGQVQLAYLFTAGLDACMHAHTTTGERTDAAFRKFEGWLGQIMETADRRYREVRVHLFSDHGMMDTVATSPMMRDFEALGLQYGRDYAAVWDSTMARFWFPGGDGVRSRIEDWLAARPEGRVLRECDLAENHCLFPDARYGELFYLLDNGTIFVPSYMNRHRVPAMHGFSPQHAESTACWLANYNCPNPPARLDGIFEVMRDAAER